MARAGRRVCLLERGAEMHPGDYPNDTLGVLAAVQFDSALLRAGSPAAMFDIRYNPDINVVVGCGLGGTSLINAGIALRPDPAVFASPLWPAELQQAADLDPYVARAEQVLRPAHCPPAMMASAKTASLGRIAAAAGKEAISIPVLVNFEPLPDGLNHAGVAQIPCVGCGDCVTGCNYGAKNTVLMNYLPDAKAHGAEIYTGAQVRRVEKNAAGWTVHGYLPGNENAGAAFAVAADIVILAAGTLGSTEILLRSRDQGLPLSPALGSRFSGNGDTIGFVYNADDAATGSVLHCHGGFSRGARCAGWHDDGGWRGAGRTGAAPAGLAGDRGAPCGRRGETAVYDWAAKILSRNREQGPRSVSRRRAQFPVHAADCA
jgi:cholesterol oxidase